MKKYEFTGEVKYIGRKILHRIRAVRDIPEYEIKSGDMGGWLETEENLSHNGAAWVANSACVMDSARVTDSALVMGTACVTGKARVTGSARVTGKASVTDSARVMGSARVTGEACVTGNACVTGKARVTGEACVTGNACVTGKARVTGKAWVSGNARVMKSSDCITIGAIGSRNDTTTFYRGADGKIYVSRGCFNSTIDDFAAEVKQVHAGTKHERTYLLAIELAKAQIATAEEEDKC